MAQQMQSPQCEHYWATVREPWHRLYSIRQCMLCHRVDWEDLDYRVDVEVQELHERYAHEIDALRQRIAKEALDG